MTLFFDVIFQKLCNFQILACSVQFRNLRNLEIAQRILRIRKLRTMVVQSRDCTVSVRNLEIVQYLLLAQ